jgi:hypothetical protein
MNLVKVRRNLLLTKLKHIIFWNGGSINLFLTKKSSCLDPHLEALSSHVSFHPWVDKLRQASTIISQNITSPSLSICEQE